MSNKLIYIVWTIAALILTLNVMDHFDDGGGFLPTVIALIAAVVLTAATTRGRSRGAHQD